MKKLLPILCLTVLISNTSCDTEQEQCVNPGFAIAGSTDGNACSNGTTAMDSAIKYYHDYDMALIDTATTATLKNFYIHSPGGYSFTAMLWLPSDIQYVADSATFVKRFALNDTIDSSANWQNDSGNNDVYLYRDVQAGNPPYIHSGEWIDEQPGYIGLRTQYNNNWYYAWVNLKVTNADTSIHVLGWSAYHP